MAKKTGPRATGKGKRWWHALSEADKKKHSFWRFDAGHSNSKVMADLGLSVGTVSGIKRRWTESSTAQEPADQALPAASAHISETPPEPSVQAPVQLPEVKVDPSELKFTASEWLACNHFVEPHKQCGYLGTEQKKTGRYCKKHAHLYK